MGLEPMDLVLTKDALYQLSYSSPPAQLPPRAPRSIITKHPQPPQNRAPPAKKTPAPLTAPWAKAGEGNRTLVNGLEGHSFTIKLHPQTRNAHPGNGGAPGRFAFE